MPAVEEEDFHGRAWSHSPHCRATERITPDRFCLLVDRQSRCRQIGRRIRRSTSATEVSMVRKSSEAVARSYRRATRLYLPRSIAQNGAGGGRGRGGRHGAVFA